MKIDYAVLTRAIENVKNPRNDALVVGGGISASMAIADTVGQFSLDELGVPPGFSKTYAAERIFRKYMTSPRAVAFPMWSTSNLFDRTPDDNILIDRLKAIRRTLR